MFSTQFCQRRAFGEAADRLVLPVGLTAGPDGKVTSTFTIGPNGEDFADARVLLVGKFIAAGPNGPRQTFDRLEVEHMRLRIPAFRQAGSDCIYPITQALGYKIASLPL